MARRTSGARKTEKEQDLFGLEPFLTAFDPSDLPGSSIDPLGFDRGYNFLADRILPGLTNVGRRPRYFSLLCAGASLAQVAGDLPERMQYEARLPCVLRLERLWVLANLLGSDEENLSSRAGVRGALYGRDRLAQLDARGEKRTGTDFELLARQVTYGVVGIYGSVAEGMKLVDRWTLSLTPALGGRLGEAFLSETEVPSGVVKAACHPEVDVSLAQLTEWGRRAHILSPPGAVEAECLGEALHVDGVRSRMAELLMEYPYKSDRETELERLFRIARASATRKDHPDLHEALDLILAFEPCYQAMLLAFERLLWLARQSDTQSVPVAAAAGDSILAEVAAELPAAVRALEQAIEAASTPALTSGMQRLADARQFLQAASTAVSGGGGPGAFLEALVGRHGQVQRGKFDMGRPKLPWIERRGSRFELTLARAGDLRDEPTSVKQVRPHEYRVQSADALIAAAEGRVA